LPELPVVETEVDDAKRVKKIVKRSKP